MSDSSPAGLTLLPQATYVRTLRPALPKEAFDPARSRLVLIPAHLAVVVVATLAIARGWVPWWIVPALSIAIGVSFACLAFVAHEAMHGGIVRGRRMKYLVGWIGFLPFGLSPRLWAAWHDRVHHANANLPDDPDMFPTLEQYHTSRRVRFFINVFGVGGRRWRGLFTLVLGFNGQITNQLVAARGLGYLTPGAHWVAIAETALAVAIWGTVGFLVGLVPFVFVYLIPLLIANTIVMAFILTNHSLSPQVTVNDPLVTGLSVTLPRWLEWLTLRFGFHVEHHVFPGMSSRHGPAVRKLLRDLWPERYQSMSLFAALRALHHTARVYKDPVTLIDPRTGRTFPTLLPTRTSS